MTTKLEKADSPNTFYVITVPQNVRIGHIHKLQNEFEAWRYNDGKGDRFADPHSAQQWVEQAA